MEFLHIDAGQLIQAALMLFGMGAAVQLLRGDIKNHAERLDSLDHRLEKFDTRMEKVETAMVAVARQDERMIAMDQRLLAQGQRIDAQATIINGRLEAINNIVSGHTAQLNSLERTH